MPGRGDARDILPPVSALQILILIAAAFGAGVMNAMAGGGTACGKNWLKFRGG